MVRAVTECGRFIFVNPQKSDKEETL